MQHYWKPWWLAALVVFITSLHSSHSEDSGFVVEPEEAVIAPVGERVILNCSVKEDYEIVEWSILLPNSTTPLSTGNIRNSAPLRKQGYEVLGQSSNRSSFLAINGTKENSRTTATCVLAEVDSITIVCSSRSSLLTFYGPPSVPSNLIASENGVGSLNISWSLSLSSLDEIATVPVKFTVLISNLNDSGATPIREGGIEDRHYVLTIEGLTSCSDVYSVQVTAWNDAGSSNISEPLETSIPSIPDISPIEDSLQYSLTKVSWTGVTLTVTLNDTSLCVSYPTQNYTLVARSADDGNESSTIVQTSSHDGGVLVDLVLQGLMEDTRYTFYVIVTNQFGTSNRSAFVEILTIDVQSISLCLVSAITSNYSIQCGYLAGSNASGCIFILVSGRDGVENITGTIAGNDSETRQILDIEAYDAFLAFDLEEGDLMGDLPLTGSIGDIEECLIEGDPGGAVLSLGAIVGIALGLAVVLFAIIALAAFLMVCKRGCSKSTTHTITPPKQGSYAINEDFLPRDPVAIMQVLNAKQPDGCHYDVLLPSPRRRTPVQPYLLDPSYEVLDNKTATIEADPEAPPIPVYSTPSAVAVGATRKVLPFTTPQYPQQHCPSGGDSPTHKIKLSLEYAKINPKTRASTGPPTY